MDISRKLSIKFILVWSGVWITLIYILLVDNVQLYGGILLSVIFALASYVMTLILSYFINLE